ncbi:MAG: mycothiol synthase, partial [Actinomycetota bacterium]
PFKVGEDNEAWLDLNNRAFAWHPEQSNWTDADLDNRFAQPWFDADGFLVHEVDGKMLGFCWTKRHDEYDPPLGEIYVIAKDTAAGEPGLGKQLTLAGLAYLASTGLTEGMLYVDATNTKALDMYLAMGFTVHHVDRNYVGAATPTNAPTP